ncbi:MAG: endonuclease, partial [Myxococcota bacterium]
HTLDPVDTDEIERCNKISSYQHNRNPFVDWPDFVNRIEDF